MGGGNKKKLMNVNESKIMETNETMLIMEIARI